MRSGIDRDHARRKREALRGAALFGLLQLACGACFGSLCFAPGMPGWLVWLFGVLAVLCAALVIPALWALKERFQEIEGGEFDEARHY